jgi:hypothetical protein
MRKADAEKGIRYLCTEWASEQGITIPRKPPNLASFSAFKTWIHQKGHSRYLDFRSRMGPLYDAERWFDDEMGQNWAN